MRKLTLLFITFVLVSFCLPSLSVAQSEDYTFVFYNVENLFDTVNDQNVLDDEFTPDGPKKWTDVKYAKKLANLEKVLFDLSKSQKDYPTIVTVSEIENRRVLDDIASTPALLPANYQIIHYDSPERRGVDVALFYRPDQFEYLWSDPIKPIIPEWPEFVTRDILAVCGKIEGELFCFFVNHWSSRWGGAQASEYLRCGAAQTLRDYTDSLSQVYPDIKYVIMGDMNDDPHDKSLYEVLGAKEDRENIATGDFYNPFYNMLKAGYGSLAYQDGWNIFDNIVVNKNLVDGGEGKLVLKSRKKGKFYGNIFKRKYMITQRGQYKNYPFRTYSGNAFMNGYSDHLPVYIIVGKN